MVSPDSWNNSNIFLSAHKGNAYGVPGFDGFDESYVAKVLRLTLLAPDIIERILDGRQPDVLTWRELIKPFPMLWSEQREKWGIQLG